MNVSDYAEMETERVKKALPKMEKGDVRFAFIPDFHYKSIDEMKVSLSNMIGALNKLNDCGKIEFVCFGGDNVGNYPNSREDHIAMMKDLAARTKDFDMPCLFVQGNHDDNSIHGKRADSYVCDTGFEVTNDIQYDILFSHEEKFENYHSGGEKALYGYYDVPSADTRFVLLNSNDVPYIVNDGVLKYIPQWDFGYTGKELLWLCEKALKNAPKYVIFIEHIPFDNAYHSDDVRINSDALDKITSAFINGEKIHISLEDDDFGYDIEADFSGERHIVPVRIAGHCHFDSATVDKSGFLSVTTMLAGRKNSGVAADMNGVTFEREPYSDKESSIDIFTFSPSRGKIFATRYGSGENREFSVL